MVGKPLLFHGVSSEIASNHEGVIYHTRHFFLGNPTGDTTLEVWIPFNVCCLEVIFTSLLVKGVHFRCEVFGIDDNIFTHIVTGDGYHDVWHVVFFHFELGRTMLNILLVVKR